MAGYYSQSILGEQMREAFFYLPNYLPSSFTAVSVTILKLYKIFVTLGEETLKIVKKNF